MDQSPQWWNVWLKAEAGTPSGMLGAVGLSLSQPEWGILQNYRIILFEFGYILECDLETAVQTPTHAESLCDKTRACPALSQPQQRSKTH